MSSFKPVNIKLSGTYLTINPDIIINLEQDTYTNKESIKQEAIVNRVLLKGKVTNPQKEPIANAGVEVIRLNKKINEKRVLGVIFTQEDGTYAVSVEVNKDYDYMLNVYCPL